MAHMFYCINERAYILWWGIDYASICFAVCMASLVYGHFTFYCNIQQEIFFFLSVIGLFISTILSVLFVASASIRTGSFVLYVSFANAVPLIYQVVFKIGQIAGNDVPSQYVTLWTLVIGVSSVGLILKATSFPELCCPGKLDVWFSSHQWWHCCINFSQFLTFWSWKSYLAWRQSNTCPS
eukprot:TRINITY_DN7491_c0_g1_i5.p1 TRINITY_DN7491_c0_g1~~TRINITY_DN7491_c0_g1_i5.p1  ORF type:complete len:181 (+),score=25.12 TRINITY_DN7491_c0_g1_i5:51-593(+)